MTRSTWTVALVLASCQARANDGDDATTKKPESYTVAAATDPVAVTKDTPANYAITITPKAPWVLKSETPLKISLAPSEGVEVDKATLTAADLEDVAEGGSKLLKTAVAASSAGEHTIAADLSFFLCKADICQRFEHELQTTFTCQEPTAE